jgi:hypothetical protein
MGACHAAIDLAEKRPELFVSTDAPPSGKFALSLRACWGGEVRPGGGVAGAIVAGVVGLIKNKMAS